MIAENAGRFQEPGKSISKTTAGRVRQYPWQAENRIRVKVKPDMLY